MSERRQADQRRQKEMEELERDKKEQEKRKRANRRNKLQQPRQACKLGVLNTAEKGDGITGRSKDLKC